MTKAHRAAVRVFSSNQLAGGEDVFTREQRERLYSALENFVNISDDEAAYEMFAAQSPDFFPMEIDDGSGNRLTWVSECQEMVLTFRDLLRSIWRSDPRALRDETLRILMSLAPEVFQNSEGYYSGSNSPAGHFDNAIRKLKIFHPDVKPISANIIPSWRSGIFIYRPLNAFQNALYLLFRESWRARVCPSCERFFIADKAARMYCTSRCSGEARRRRDLDWWRREGSHKRRTESAKQRTPQGRSKRKR